MPTYLTGKKLLIIDDNAHARDALTKLLANYDCSVQALASGEDALAMLAVKTEDCPFDLILVDLQMPTLDEIETIRQIKTRDLCSKIPTLLMLTTFTGEEIIKLAEATGINGFLFKSITETSLRDTLRELLAPSKLCSHGMHRTVSEAVLAHDHLINRRVLLVEDNPINTELAVKLLTELGIIVETAENGRIGVSRVMNEVFYLVLMDVQMPELDGMSATRLMRNDPRFNDLPIIAMITRCSTLNS